MLVPNVTQAVRTALVALQRHHRDRQAEMLNKQYSYESALKDGARSAQEVSEEILQQQHKVPSICDPSDTICQPLPFKLQRTID
jgi:hypothetical protein